MTFPRAFQSALYRGDLMHARHDHLAHRTFSYGVYMAALDLEELASLDRELRLFSHRRLNLFAFDDRDYTTTLAPSRRADPDTRRADADTRRANADTCRDLRDSLAALRAANDLPVPHTTRLVTNLRVAGYVFNPVSFFLDYDKRGALTSAIAEVNNTYGGRFRYVLGPSQRLPIDIATARTSRSRVGFRHVRELFVSPFLHGPATYDFWFDAPLDGESLSIEMHVHGDTRVFTARLTALRSPLSDRSLAAAALRYPLMTLQVIGLIHYEAFKLRLAGLPYRRPGRDHRPLEPAPR